VFVCVAACVCVGVRKKKGVFLLVLARSLFLPFLLNKRLAGGFLIPQGRFSLPGEIRSYCYSLRLYRTESYFVGGAVFTSLESVRESSRRVCYGEFFVLATSNFYSIYFKL
jgi:hypothetical protein